jgi:hypothetical protein
MAVKFSIKLIVALRILPLADNSKLVYIFGLRIKPRMINFDLKYYKMPKRNIFWAHKAKRITQVSWYP